MSADNQPSVEELQERVEQLEAEIKDGGGEAVSRRDFGKAGVLAALGLGGVAGSAGTVAAQESSNQEVGTIGTDSARVDVFADTVDANELVGVETGGSGGQNSVKYASDHSGADGGAQIQAAIDAADNESGRNVVIVGPVGPDTNQRWDTASTITVPSNTTVILQNSHLYLKSGSDVPIFRNEDTVNGNSDIAVIGFGTPIVDGNASGQSRTSAVPTTDDHAIDFTRVTNLRVENIEIRNSNAYGVKVEDVEKCYIEDVIANQDNSTDNQDVVHVHGPSEKVKIDGVYGIGGHDNPIALTATENSEEPIHHSNGDITDVTIENISVAAQDSIQGVVKLLTGDGNVVRRVTVEKVMASAPQYDSIIEFGPASYPNSAPAPADLQNITIGDISFTNPSTSNTIPVVRFNSPASQVSVSDVTAAGYCEGVKFVSGASAVDGVDITGVTIDGANNGTTQAVSFEGAGTISNVDVSGVTATGTSNIVEVLDSTVNSLSISGVSIDAPDTTKAGFLSADSAAVVNDLSATGVSIGTARYVTNIVSGATISGSITDVSGDPANLSAIFNQGGTPDGIDFENFIPLVSGSFTVTGGSGTGVKENVVSGVTTDQTRGLVVEQWVSSGPSAGYATRSEPPVVEWDDTAGEKVVAVRENLINDPGSGNDITVSYEILPGRT